MMISITEEEYKELISIKRERDKLQNIESELQKFITPLKTIEEPENSTVTFSTDDLIYFLEGFLK